MHIKVHKGSTACLLVMSGSQTILTDLLSEPVEQVHQIELNRLKRFTSPMRTNPQIT